MKSASSNATRTQVIILILLPILYLFLVNPISDFWGGILFLLLGWITPSVFILLLSYLITKKVARHAHVIVKLMLILIISFVIGVHVKIPTILPSLAFKTPEVHVEKPLTLIVDKTYGVIPSVYTDVTDNILLKPSSFDTVNLGGDEGCMCMYFKLPETISDTANRQLQDLIRIFATQQGVQPGLYAHGYILSGPAGHAAYTMSIESTIKHDQVVMITRITDNYGGLVRIKNIYPSWLIMKKGPEFFPRGENQKGYFKNSVILFLNNNFWQWILRHYLRAPLPTSTLLESNAFILRS